MHRPDRLNEIAGEAREWFEASWDTSLTLRQWWSLLAESGWGFPTWPEGRFGRGLTTDQTVVVDRERRLVGALGPPRGIATMLAGPTLLTHGTEDQLDRYLPGIVTGEHIWCQLFSEPSSGSDLASVRTRAVRDGDEWIVDGQKVWTSGAHKARYGILIARTNPEVPKHRGITYFAIDMHQPGIEVRPLREMTGRAVFNEVFLTGAVVSNDDVIGDVNDGWRVANTTLNNERAGLGSTGDRGGGRLDIADHPLDLTVAEVLAAGEEHAQADRLPRGHHLLTHLARELDRIDEPLVRSRVANEAVAGEVSRLSGMRIRAMAEEARRRGERAAPSPLVSVQKMAASKNLHSLGRGLVDVQGARGMLAGEDALIDDRAMETIATAFMISIGGGTDQIQRNIVGERVLGLPGEPRVDKDVPFKDLPK